MPAFPPQLVHEQKPPYLSQLLTYLGIPDFRGPEGAWTLRAQGRSRTGKATSTLQAIPTPTHMALVELQRQGVMKYLVSQNCDGLHRRSGITRVGNSDLLLEPDR